MTETPRLSDLRVKIFADGADVDTMAHQNELRHDNGTPLISGFTTNPTLMRKAGVTDYRKFAKDVLAWIPDKPISFEVFSDDFAEMELQAREIASWGKNVYVKIPITNSLGASAGDLVYGLSGDSIKLNVTAVMTQKQVRTTWASIFSDRPSIVSIFAGRIADTGLDPFPIMRWASEFLMGTSIKVLWASPRSVLDIFNADRAGCDYITVTNDILKKLPLIGSDLKDYSLDTVKMFRDDAVAAGFTLSSS